VGQVFIIPLDYETIPWPQRSNVIPICVPAVDPRGLPIPLAWLERGVAPVYKQILKLATFTLGDPWCASEIAEVAVNRLFERHGEELGNYPWRQVLREAAWIAKDLVAGGTRADRNRRALEISLENLEGALIDPTDYADTYHREMLLDSVERNLESRGMIEMTEIFCLVRLGHTWKEIADHFGEASEEVLKRRFYRWLKTAPQRLFESLGG
jgi:hypothetical protein